MTDDELLALESDYRAYRELVSRWLWLNRIVCLALGVALGVGVGAAL